MRDLFSGEKVVSWGMVPCVIFEDEHLLVVNKPAGWNTHAPGPHAGEGIYDWLRARESRWASLAIIHRLDKETSGMLVFGKTALANKSLTQQFTDRKVHKCYFLLTDRKLPALPLIVKTPLLRVGEKYASRPGGEMAETRFTATENSAVGPVRSGSSLICAEPLTGRTHQIRVHAAENGFPILGDTLYGGTPSARVCLHAGEIAFTHPATHEPVTFSVPAAFDRQPRLALRDAIIEPEATNAFRLIHGASDGWPDWYVEKLGDYLLSQSEAALTPGQNAELMGLAEKQRAKGVYHKTLSRHVRQTHVADASPQLIRGEPAPERFTIRENGLSYELSFAEGYSVGLFLDQRDNRRRLLTGHLAAHFPPAALQRAQLLNCFAYTCGFSVCAAQAGARTTSLDLSKKYLEWGRRNFVLNGLDPAAHDFIFGDAFDWLRRLAKKGRAFDWIVLDPPTFSQSKETGAFRVEKNYGELVAAALCVLKPEGVLLASTNAAHWPAEKFLEAVSTSVVTRKRKILQEHYAPQPPDFPVSRNEPAYLKTVWLKIG